MFDFSGIFDTSPCNISIHGKPIWYGAQSTHQHSFASEECVCCKSTFMTGTILLRFYYFLLLRLKCVSRWVGQKSPKISHLALTLVTILGTFYTKSVAHLGAQAERSAG